ncbi:unnamed protein product [Rotaria sp. Silwood1]|nr:unnamed protein product [Rotaria sp. Silwood1]
MSSSTFIQRWTSVNDLTTTTANSNNNKQSTSFFLRPQPVPSSSPLLSTLHLSQSSISLVESTPIDLEIQCQLFKNRVLSSRVANIIHQFESQAASSMNTHTKVSSPIRSVFVKQWEGTRKNGNSPRTPPIVVVETSSSMPFTAKKNNNHNHNHNHNHNNHNHNNNNKPQPIIICEKIANHNRPTPPPVSPKSSLTKTWSQLKQMSQQQQKQQGENIESDTGSAVHRMVAVINNGTKDSVTLSRSSTSATTDSTCSSSCSSSSNAPSPPGFARPTIASTQKQRQSISNVTTFKRANSPFPPVTTFTRTISSTPSTNVPLCSINEDLEQQQIQTSTLTNRFCSPDGNLVDQYRQLSTSEIILSETSLSQNPITEIITINTNLPLKYKRDSLIRLYG